MFNNFISQKGAQTISEILVKFPKALRKESKKIQDEQNLPESQKAGDDKIK